MFNCERGEGEQRQHKATTDATGRISPGVLLLEPPPLPRLTLEHCGASTSTFTASNAAADSPVSSNGDPRGTSRQRELPLCTEETRGGYVSLGGLLLVVNM
ncbi:hypothetical protein CgunFtcFv8_002517 [Champsocephalus gunnari]|uniref:Uncharacterized protein n=1 Tax=Champsocephalus gunnari TaxID=52237 RepID=A0AAN8DA16_CHAGU|nr:hypothetical protein CgunFtcFv8_002517 [Champsocephalus gunnari]